MLHMTRVAFGCDNATNLLATMAARAVEGRLYLNTRYRPKRFEEIAAGGSLYWIIKHQFVARAPVLAFEDAPDSRCHIVLAASPIVVVPKPRRAHQGWRYLTLENAPPDLDAAGDGAALLPTELTGRLGELGLL